MIIHARRPKAAAQRLSPLKAHTKSHLVSNENSALTRMHRRVPPGAAASTTPIDQQPDKIDQPDQTLASRLLALSSGTRALVAVLVLIAVVLNLGLGAILILGAINIFWSRPVMSPPNASARALPPPVLSAPATLEATAGEDVIFPIALDGTDGVPVRSIIAISGLPQGSTLSSGRPYGETEWNLKTDEIGDLHLTLPINASGKAKLTIGLVGPDGSVIADTGLVLKMDFAARPEPPETQVSVELVEGLGTIGKKERSANLGVPMTEDPVPLPSRRPMPTASHVDAGWLRPLTFVNLREGPSPSAPVVSVVAKGAKLQVIGRKGRWVQVTHSSTSKSGWVYTGNVATAR
jgi:Bacterial SH3 domain